MATPPEQPWSNHEKNYLLAEIIKAANPPPQLLFNVLRDRSIQPRWEDIPLPPGRSLNSCRFAFEELRRSLSMQSMPTPMAPGPHTPTPLSQPPVTLKRPYQYEGGSFSAGTSGREIRPKPHAGVAFSQPSPTEPPPKRKRGRPTKAEAQAKAELAAAAASAGDAGPSSTSSAPTPAITTASTSRPSTQTPAPMIAPPVPQPSMTTQETKLSQPPPTSTSMPIAAMLTPNIREPQSASQSSSSSGKRRRARSTKSEPEETPLARAGADYESPYGRVRGGAEDSPARTAVLRHREDPAFRASDDTVEQQSKPGTEPH